MTIVSDQYIKMYRDRISMVGKCRTGVVRQENAEMVNAGTKKRGGRCRSKFTLCTELNVKYHKASSVICHCV